MSNLLDALDQLASVRDLVNLMGMACRKSPDEDEKALGTCCHIILEQLERAEALLTADLPDVGLSALKTEGFRL